MEEQDIQKLRDLFSKVFKNAQKQHFVGIRPQDKSAWYSEQRDLVNLMPFILSASASIARYTMPEDLQNELENFPSSIQKAITGDEAGAITLPQLLDNFYTEHPEAASEFLKCIGLTTLLFQGMLPVFKIQPDQQLYKEGDSEVLFGALMTLLSPKLEKKIKKELKDTYYSSDLFSDNMSQFIKELREIDKHIIDQEAKEQ